MCFVAHWSVEALTPSFRSMSGSRIHSTKAVRDMGCELVSSGTPTKSKAEESQGRKASGLMAQRKAKRAAPGRSKHVDGSQSRSVNNQHCRQWCQGVVGQRRGFIKPGMTWQARSFLTHTATEGASSTSHPHNSCPPRPGSGPLLFFERRRRMSF